MKKRICIVLLIVIALLLTACSRGVLWQWLEENKDKLQEQMDDAQVREMAIQVVDAAIAEDYETVSSLLNRAYISDADVAEMYPLLVNFVAGMEAYELTPTHKNVHTVNGVSTVSIQYLLEAEDRTLILEVSRKEGEPGLMGIGMWEFVPETQTGTVSSMGGADALQWILLVIGVLECAFVLWMFIDCCCHKMKKKWLWLLITGAGTVIFSLTVKNGFRINWNIGLFLCNNTALIRYSTSGFLLRLMVPVGAVVYASIRKHLFRAYEASLKPPAPPQWDPAQMPVTPPWASAQTPVPPVPGAQTTAQPETETDAAETSADEA